MVSKKKDTPIRVTNVKVLLTKQDRLSVMKQRKIIKVIFKLLS